MTDTLVAPETEVEQRGNGAPAVVRSEPRVYGPGSDASYFQDKALATLRNAPGSEEAIERQRKYAEELHHEISRGSQEGRRAERIQAFAKRSSEQPEFRAATSTTIAGFTTPEYLISDYALYRTPSKSFTDQTTKLPLTPYGLQINVPSFTGAATNVQQSAENTGVIVATVPPGLNIPVNLVTIAVVVPISQQLYDRGGLSGEAFDKILLAQMLQNQDAAVDLYVINQALANAYSGSYQSSASIANFLEDLAVAREGLADTAGTRLAATHLFTTSDQFGYWSRQLATTSGVPFILPDSSAIMMAEQLGDPKWESWTGVHLGPLRWHTDDNIPPTGTNTQLIVARPREIYTFDGENYAFSYPETAAQNLTVNVGLRTYVGAVVRFPKAIASITSNAYPLTNV